MHRRKVALEDISSVEGLFSRGASVGAKAADHSALVMGQGMTVFVVLASEALDVVLATSDASLLAVLIQIRFGAGAGCDRGERVHRRSATHVVRLLNKSRIVHRLLELRRITRLRLG